MTMSERLAQNSNELETNGTESNRAIRLPGLRRWDSRC